MENKKDLSTPITLQMHEDYCCGGGHCGPLPGYEYKCPACSQDTYAHTGVPLTVGDEFSCSHCEQKYKVLNVLPEVHFEILAIDG